MKKAVVFIKGGFGNQLFQLAFAHYLKCKNFNVKLNTDLLKINKSDTKRKLGVSLKDFELKEASKYSKFLHKFIQNFYYSDLAKKLNINTKFEYSRYLKMGDDFLSIDQKRYYFNDYWKDIQIVENSADYIKESLQKNIQFKKALSSQKDKNLVMLHVRRGDYIKLGWDLGSFYYENSIHKLLSKNKNLKFHIFTDDKNWVLKQDFSKNVDEIFFQQFSSDNLKETHDTFSAMLMYKNFIISNSSYSFWAAFLSSDSESLVTVPNPWFNNKQHPVLKKTNWYEVNSLKNK